LGLEYEYASQGKSTVRVCNSEVAVYNTMFATLF